MNRLHLFIIEDLNLWSLCPKGTPLLECLIFAAQVSSFLIFIMTESCILAKIIPLYCTIAVACYIILCSFGFPFEPSAWVASHSRSVDYSDDFALINVIDSDLSVWTGGTHMFIVRADFQWENFGVSVAEKAYKPGLVWGQIFLIEFKNSRTEVFLLDFMRCMLEQVIPLLLCDFLFDERCGHSQICSQILLCWICLNVICESINF